MLQFIKFFIDQLVQYQKLQMLKLQRFQLFALLQIMKFLLQQRHHFQKQERNLMLQYLLFLHQIIQFQQSLQCQFQKERFRFQMQVYQFKLNLIFFLKQLVHLNQINLQVPIMKCLQTILQQNQFGFKFQHQSIQKMKFQHFLLLNSLEHLAHCLSSKQSSLLPIHQIGFQQLVLQQYYQFVQILQAYLLMSQSQRQLWSYLLRFNRRVKKRFCFDLLLSWYYQTDHHHHLLMKQKISLAYQPYQRCLSWLYFQLQILKHLRKVILSQMVRQNQINLLLHLLQQKSLLLLRIIQFHYLMVVLLMLQISQLILPIRLISVNLQIKNCLCFPPFSYFIYFILIIILNCFIF